MTYTAAFRFDRPRSGGIAAASIVTVDSIEAAHRWLIAQLRQVAPDADGFVEVVDTVDDRSVTYLTGSGAVVAGQLLGTDGAATAGEPASAVVFICAPGALRHEVAWDEDGPSCTGWFELDAVFAIAGVDPAGDYLVCQESAWLLARKAKGAFGDEGYDTRWMIDPVTEVISYRPAGCAVPLALPADADGLVHLPAAEFGTVELERDLPPNHVYDVAGQLSTDLVTVAAKG